MKTISKIKIRNFKRFKSLDVSFNKDINILIGDNESGKSTILQAIDFVASGSRYKVEQEGLERLFNIDCISEFQANRSYENLPILRIELYLDDIGDHNVCGKNNLEKDTLEGIKLVCKPDDNYREEIQSIISDPESIFPFEFYTIEFSTFANTPYNGHKKYISGLFIDQSIMGAEYAMREYVRDIYRANLTPTERAKNNLGYRKLKADFQRHTLATYNDKFSDATLSVKDTIKSSLETDISLSEGGIDIENKGRGHQCFVKAKLALSRQESNIDFVLMEEPENHLSHINMGKLIQLVSNTTGRQLFISTHSDMICSRLNLKKVIMLNSNDQSIATLSSLNDETARFFMKAPNYNLLQFVLSKKVILVEGNVEYMLVESFFEKHLQASIAQQNVHIISVGGLSFKRYLEVAQCLNIKTAVITDNDKDYNSKVDRRYNSFVCDSIKVFSDADNERYTFEVCFYKDNTEMCDTLFKDKKGGAMTLDYMLNNKTSCAFDIMECDKDYTIPQYIQSAIEWVNE